MTAAKTSWALNRLSNSEEKCVFYVIEETKRLHNRQATVDNSTETEDALCYVARLERREGSRISDTNDYNISWIELDMNIITQQQRVT